MPEERQAGVLPVQDDEPQVRGSAPWMATFADMMTLLLTFFVLMLSFASVDVMKFRDMLGSVREALGVGWRNPGIFGAAPTAPVQIFTEEARSDAIVTDEALLAELQRAVTSEGAVSEIEAEMTGRGVLLRINGRILYQQAEATLREEGHSLLRRIAGLAEASDHAIMIEGHTDDRPIQTREFPSNWELSTARAIAAMRFFVDHGVDARRIGVAGYADLRPLEPNDSDQRRALNRRVEFVFSRGDGGGQPAVVPDIGRSAPARPAGE